MCGVLLKCANQRIAVMMVNCAQKKTAHAVPLASARQHPPENQKENQAGHSSERAVRAGFFFWFHGIFAGMGNRFFLAREAFFAREREKKLLCFKSVFGVFWCFWCFLVFFFVFRALARKNVFSGAGMRQTGNSRSARG